MVFLGSCPEELRPSEKNEPLPVTTRWAGARAKKDLISLPSKVPSLLGSVKADSGQDLEGQRKTFGTPSWPGLNWGFFP